MAVMTGKNATVKIKSGGSLKLISYMSTASWSGFTSEGVEMSVFGLDYKLFKPVIIDSGTIEITGYYDPADDGQEALNAAGAAGTELKAGDIAIELDEAGTTYVRPISGGTDNYWLVTKWNPITIDAKDINKTSFTLRCSGQSEIVTA